MTSTRLIHLHLITRHTSLLQIHKTLEPKLETTGEIKQEDAQRKSDQDWQDNFLNGVKTTEEVVQELNDQAIADLLSEEVMAPQIDTEIDPLFIDDDDVFANKDLTDENKKFIKTLLDKSNYDIASDDDIKTEIIDNVVPPDPLFFLAGNEIFTPKTEPDLIPSIETGIESVDDKNWNNYVKLLETQRPDLLVDEPDNTQDDRQNLIQTDLCNKDLIGEDTKTDHDILNPTIKIEPNIDVVPKDVPSIYPTIRVTNENDGNNDLIDIKNIPLPKWIPPANRFKRRVRQLQNNRKKVYSRDDEYRKKAKRKAI